MSEPNDTDQLTFSYLEAPASPSPSPESASAWMTRAATWRSSPWELLLHLLRLGSSLRTSLDSCHRESDGTLAPSLGRWMTSGILARGQCWTLNGLAWRNGGSACSLSDILETGDIPQRYCLSQKACRGILRRAEKRGKTLPPALRRALKAGGGGLGTDFDCGGGLVASRVSPTLRSGGNKTGGDHRVPTWIPSKHSAIALPLLANSNNSFDNTLETYVTHALRADGFDASEDGTGRGTPLVPAVAPCLTQNYSKQPDNSDTNAGPMLVPTAFNLRGQDGGAQPEVADKARLRSASGGSSRSYVAGQAVRRLTPRECERLQGFEDDYTLVTHRGKPAADGPRYKALGNSMAVPVVRWIGERIREVDGLTEK